MSAALLRLLLMMFSGVVQETLWQAGGEKGLQKSAGSLACD